MPATLEITAVNKGGCPVGSRNALRTGKRMTLPLGLGTAPKGMRRQVSDARQKMSELASAVLESRGATSVDALTPFEVSVINEYGEAEVTRRLCWRLWNKNQSELSVSDLLSIRRDAERASEKRTKCIVRLGLDRTEDDDGWPFPSFPAIPEAPDIGPGTDLGAADADDDASEQPPASTAAPEIPEATPTAPTAP